MQNVGTGNIDALKKVAERRIKPKISILGRGPDVTL
jgi:hypothetical protein